MGEPLKMWAIMDPRGKIVRKQFGVSKDEAWWHFLGKPDINPSSFNDDADRFASIGYRAVRVTVTIEEEDQS